MRIMDFAFFFSSPGLPLFKATGIKGGYLPSDEENLRRVSIFSFEPTINRSSVVGDIQTAMFRTSFPSICNEEMGQNKIIEGLFGVECLWSIEKVKSVRLIVRSAQCLHVRGRIKTQQLNMTENKG